MALLLITSLIQGCDGPLRIPTAQEVTREHARKALETFLMEATRNQGIDIAGQDDLLIQACFVDTGIVNYYPSVYHPNKQAQITGEGRALRIESSSESMLQVIMGYNIDITGIKMIDDNTVEFITITKIIPTKIGECMWKFSYHDIAKDKLQGTGTLEKWDDGWRIAKAEGSCAPLKDCSIIESGRKSDEELKELSTLAAQIEERQHQFLEQLFLGQWYRVGLEPILGRKGYLEFSEDGKANIGDGETFVEDSRPLTRPANYRFLNNNRLEVGDNGQDLTGTFEFRDNDRIFVLTEPDGTQLKYGRAEARKELQAQEIMNELPATGTPDDLSGIWEDAWGDKTWDFISRDTLVQSRMKLGSNASFHIEFVQGMHFYLDLDDGTQKFYGLFLNSTKTRLEVTSLTLSGGADTEYFFRPGTSFEQRYADHPLVGKWNCDSGYPDLQINTDGTIDFSTGQTTVTKYIIIDYPFRFATLSHLEGSEKVFFGTENSFSFRLAKGKLYLARERPWVTCYRTP